MNTTLFKPINHQRTLGSTQNSGPITGKLNYLVPDTETPTHYTFTPPEGIPWENVEYEAREVEIRDARLASTQLDVQGFELWEAPSEVRNFDNVTEVRSVYYPEIERLVKLATGANRAIVFDHLVRQRRTESEPLDFGRREEGVSVVPANGRIHNDYTEASGSRRLEMVIDELQARQSICRFSIVNVWRSIGDPVIDTPLAVCDSQSISTLDLVQARVIYPKREGEIYVLKHSSRHRWYYFPDMYHTEALIFKQYDSELTGVSRFTPHAAFQNPLGVAHQKPRKSIEVRCLVVHDMELPQ